MRGIKRLAELQLTFEMKCFFSQVKHLCPKLPGEMGINENTSKLFGLFAYKQHKSTISAKKIKARWKTFRKPGEYLPSRLLGKVLLLWERAFGKSTV